jgi:hypothetical protein
MAPAPPPFEHEQNKGDKDNGWTEDGWGTAVYNATSKTVELMPK